MKKLLTLILTLSIVLGILIIPNISFAYNENVSYVITTYHGTHNLINNLCTAPYSVATLYHICLTTPPLTGSGNFNYDLIDSATNNFIASPWDSLNTIYFAIAPPPAETCFDNIQNQNETGIDIGGVCYIPSGNGDGSESGVISSSVILLNTSISTAWNYISTLFSPLLKAVLGFIIIGGILTLIIVGIGKLFRHKKS